jgi:hypothetical protein
LTVNEAKLLALMCERGRRAVLGYTEGGGSALALALAAMRDEAVEVANQGSPRPSWAYVEPGTRPADPVAALDQRFSAMLVDTGWAYVDGRLRTPEERDAAGY